MSSVPSACVALCSSNNNNRVNKSLPISTKSLALSSNNVYCSKKDDNMTNSSTTSSSPPILRDLRDSRLKPRRRVLVVDEHDAKYRSSSNTSDNSSLVKSDQIPLMSYEDEDAALVSERPRRPTQLTVESKDL